MKPGRCPIATGPGICVMGCFGDISCPGSQKCVSARFEELCTLRIINHKFYFSVLMVVVKSVWNQLFN